MYLPQICKNIPISHYPFIDNVVTIKLDSFCLHGFFLSSSAANGREQQPIKVKFYCLFPEVHRGFIKTSLISSVPSHRFHRINLADVFKMLNYVELSDRHIEQKEKSEIQKILYTQWVRALPSFYTYHPEAKL